MSTLRKSLIAPKSLWGLAARPLRCLVPTLVLGVGVSLAISLMLLGVERARVSNEFEGAAQDRAADIRASIEPNLQTLRAAGTFYSHGNQLTREEFHKAFSQLVPQCPSVKAVEWIPRVRAEDRASHEDAARRDGLAEFQITERGPDGQLRRAGPRDEYFPVYYAEPLEGNIAALGFDLASEPVRREALLRARDGGEMAATQRIRLVQETGQQWGFLTFQPVYRPGAPVGTVEERRANLMGFVLAVFRAGQLVEGAIATEKPIGIDTWLYDLSAPAEGRLLYFHPARLRGPTAASMSGEPETETDLCHVEIFTVAGRQWQVAFRPSPQWLAVHPIWQGWVALAMGLGATALAVASLVSAAKRTARIRRLATELQDANTLLDGMAKFPRENPAPIFRVAADGTLLFANPASESLIAEWACGVGKPVPPWVQRAGAAALDCACRDEQDVEHGGRALLFQVVPLGAGGYVNWYGRDATERKAAEAAVKNQMQFLETLLETIPSPIFYKDLAGVYLGCNKAFEEFVHKPREAIIGKTVRALVSAEDAARHEEADVALLASGGRQTYEAGAPPAADGSRRVALLSKATYANADGSLAGIVCAMLDFTDRKRAEEALRQAEVRYRTLVERMPAVTYQAALDPASSALYVSPQIEQLVGFTPAEFKADPGFWLKRIHADDVSRLAEAMGRLRKTGEPMQVEYRLLARDGRERWVRDEAVLVRDDQGNPEHMQGFLADLTDRKLAEEALRRADDQLRLITAHVSDVVWSMTLDGRFTFMTASAERVVGFTAEEAMAMPIEKTMTPDSHRKTMAVLAQRLADRDFSAVSVEVELICKDGSTKWGEITSGFMVDKDGQPTGLMGVTRDISDRKQAEEAVEAANRRLEDANAQLAALATTDELTGLANRRRLMEVLRIELERVRRHGTSLAVAMLDIDHFKAINDAFGHAFGDKALAELSRLLKAEARATDTAARYGGEEFIILMPDTTAEQAYQAAERVRMRIAGCEITDGSQAVTLTVSLGTSATEAAGVVTVETLIRQADEALYMAKQSGRNCTRSWTEVAADREKEAPDSEAEVETVQRQVASLSLQARDAFVEAMLGLVHAIDARDWYASSHSENVMFYAVGIAETLGLPPRKVAVIRCAAAVHDTGRIGIPASILRKNSALTADERRIIQQHPLIGVRILDEMQVLEREIPIVRHHHEHWNGQGYPDGLAGRAIPLGARILAVADAFDAITSDRPYRPSRTVAEAVEIIRQESGRQFDPAMVDALTAWVASVCRAIGNGADITASDLRATRQEVLPVS